MNNLKLFNISIDNVINATCSIGETEYDFVLEKIYPLLDKLEEQRKLLDNKFYNRLKRDILSGCIMPPLTLAFINKSKISNIKELEKYINDNIKEGFILDGIQRLNTLERASKDKSFDPKGKIFFNVIIADNKDKLLYRMITLNNGQKGMTPRHQIEILTKELFNFEDLKIKVQTEKERSKNALKNSFSLGDISKGYMAFLTNNVNNENSKIIEEKMDEILVGRILDNDINNFDIEYYDILKMIDKFSVNEYCLNWFKVVNNLIGFSVGVIKSFKYINDLSTDELEELLKKFEKTFKSLNTSKINLGKFRRELSKEYILNIQKYSEFSDYDLDDKFFELTITE
ncbi:hypothetical protein [uncultured Chryseobacterium sp.]|uniref:hypothetical protein n=1 Tax=uncultured Chryseobacterium sp. TaxID=259322 RepID=UPI0025F4C18A|nr:hypothetical protein [uncultured Chryseobacterium sp.]